jgi:hypothetical protein
MFPPHTYGREIILSIATKPYYLNTKQNAPSHVSKLIEMAVKSKGKPWMKLFACFYPFSLCIAFLCPKSDN